MRESNIKTTITEKKPPQETTEVEFIDCKFQNCDFTSKDLSYSTFQNCKFQNCNLANTKLTESSLQTTTFDSCKLIGVIFSEINAFLIDLEFKDCKIELCEFKNLPISETKFQNCTISATEFTNTNLSRAEFTDTDLETTVFANCNLEKADFTKATRYYIDPTQNKLENAKFESPAVLALLLGFKINITN